VSSRAAAFDPFEQAYHEDPAAYVAWSRTEEPVFWSPELGYWVVTRYDDVKAVFRDNITFSPAIALEKITPSPPEVDAVLAEYDYELNRTLVNEDEPAHMPRRRVLMEPFTPEHLLAHEEMVRRLAREAVDAFIDDGQADLVTQMLYTVPLTVAMHFLGIPEADMAPLKKFAVAHTVNTWGRPAPEEQLAVAHAVGSFWQYAGGVLEKLRKDPSGPGWMPYSIRQQAEHPDIVTDSYLHSMMMAGIVAAHETTAHAAANAVKLLLEDPRRWAELCANPSLIPNAVEECLRHSGSVAAWRRIVTRDAEVGGTQVKAGEKLLIVQASANRDPEHFEDADRYDPRREEAVEHLTFGYGAHQCLGKNLARMEIQVFLQELTTRLPHLRLAPQEFAYVPNTSFRGPEHLLAEWDPAANPERRDPAVLDQELPVTVGEPAKTALARTLTVETLEHVSPDVLRLVLTDTSGDPLPRWAAGAHVDLDCGTDDDGESRSRQYSLCGDPADRTRLEVGVLLEADGRGGSRWLHEHLTPGSTVQVRGPRNHFRQRPGDEHLVLVAGGIGITPMLAHADQARLDGRSYELHFAGRSRDRMPFLERAERDHGGRLTLHVSQEGTRLDLSTLVAGFTQPTAVYACGPTRMIEELEALTEGWSDESGTRSLHVEHFESTLGALDPSKEHAFELVLKDSDLTLTVPPDRTVLQTLRAANIDIQSDCEEGLCGSCEAVVLDGRVDHRDVVLSRSERAANRSMMTCCSRAAGTTLTLQL
jgi:cytochrome P450/ferredoxin-NADP reductase